MKSNDLGICGKCRRRVPAEHVIRDGKVYLRKHCAPCGDTESLVSNDAATWQRKREIWGYDGSTAAHCGLQCDQCHVDHHPTIVFLDVTNRCNMNCPICIANIGSMGFDFNPPLAYFDKVFRRLGTLDPVPMVELFGGEPTVRDDLVEIISLARSHGVKCRIVTNGLRLADEAFCRRLCEAKVHFRVAFDGTHPEIYRRLRKNPAAYDKKIKALENLKKHSTRKHTILCCAARHINEQYIGELIQFCHDNMDFIDELGFLPLTENWEPGTFEAVEPTTCEDVEQMVEQAVPGGGVELFSAGLLHCLRTARSFFRPGTGSRYLMLGGDHPNCESMAFLVSDGKQYRTASRFLKMPANDIIRELRERAAAIEPRLRRLDPRCRLQRLRGQLLILRTFLPLARRAAKLRPLLNCLSPTAALKALAGLARGRWPSDLPRAHFSLPRVLAIVTLPFAEHRVIDAERLHGCRAVFAYEDVADGRVKTSPACTWDLYRDRFLEGISGKYGTVESPLADPSAHTRTEEPCSPVVKAVSTSG